MSDNKSFEVLRLENLLEEADSKIAKLKEERKALWNDARLIDAGDTPIWWYPSLEEYDKSRAG